jgi:hypothetical protein
MMLSMLAATALAVTPVSIGEPMPLSNSFNQSQGSGQLKEKIKTRRENGTRPGRGSGNGKLKERVKKKRSGS